MRKERNVRHPLIKISLDHNHDKAWNKCYTQDNTDTRWENPSVLIGAGKSKLHLLWPCTHCNIYICFCKWSYTLCKPVIIHIHLFWQLEIDKLVIIHIYLSWQLEIDEPVIIHIHLSWQLEIDKLVIIHNHLSRQLEIDKPVIIHNHLSWQLEIDDPKELSEDNVYDEIHPKKNIARAKFAKPKGPSSRGPKRMTKPSGDESWE